MFLAHRSAAIAMPNNYCKRCAQYGRPNVPRSRQHQEIEHFGQRDKGEGWNDLKVVIFVLFVILAALLLFGVLLPYLGFETSDTVP